MYTSFLTLFSWNTIVKKLTNKKQSCKINNFVSRWQQLHANTLHNMKLHLICMCVLNDYSLQQHSLSALELSPARA